VGKGKKEREEVSREHVSKERREYWQNPERLSKAEEKGPEARKGRKDS